jgi:hypothetical protein
VSRSMSICHPAEPNAGRGYCSKCYQAMRYAGRLNIGRPAPCHPELDVHARGLCRPCYESKRSRKSLPPVSPSLCHPSRPATRHGPCQPCHEAAISQLKRLRDFGPRTAAEPRWRTNARRRDLDRNQFPLYALPPHTPLASPAFWAWLLSPDFNAHIEKLEEL